MGERTFARTLDLDHLRLLHRWLFGDVYTWAGQIRRVPINKEGSEFARPEYIVTEAGRIFAKLRNEGALQDVLRCDLPSRLSYYFGELNALHPFREGNGRTQRLFFRQLLESRGLTLAWTRVNSEQMTAVSISVHNGNEAPLRSLFEHIITPL